MDAVDFLDGNPQPEAAEDFLQSAPSAEGFLAGGPHDSNPDLNDSELRASPESGLRRAGRAVREALTPLIGPTEEQLLTAGGEYKPLGSKVEQEGFFPSMAHPMVPIPRIPQQEGAVPQALAGAGNTALGFLEFAESPLGLATGGVGGMGARGLAGARTVAGTGVKGLQRATAGLYAADIARQVPEAAQQFGEATVNGSLQEQVEKGTGLGASVLLPGVLARHALAPGEQVTTLERPRADVLGPDQRPVVDLSGVGSLEEALAKGDQEVQTSGPAVASEAMAGGPAQEAQPVVEEPVSPHPGPLPGGEGEEMARAAGDVAEAEDAKFAIDSGGEPGQDRNWNEERQDAAVESLKRGIAADFGERFAERVRRVEPDLLHDDTAKTVGISKEVRDGIEEAFGRKIIFVAGDQKLPFSGVTVPSVKGAIFVDVRTRMPALVVAGHELVHDIRVSDPSTYNELAANLMPLVSDFPGYHERLNQLYGRVGIRRLRAGEATEEFIADFVGEQMGQKPFWEKLAGKSPGIFQRLATAAMSLLDRALARISERSTPLVRDIERAREVVADALRKFAERSGPGGGGERRFAIEEPAEREFPKKVDAAADVSAGVKEALPDRTRFYDPRTNAGDAEWARSKIEELGVPGAIAAVKDERNPMDGAQRTVLGMALLKRLGLEERTADGKGDKAGSDAAADAQVDLVNHLAARSTDIAQALQAMGVWGKMTPEGHLKEAKRVFEEVGEKKLEGLRPDLERVRAVMEQGNAEAAGEVQRAPEVQAAAESAVTEAIANSPETHTAVIVNVAGTMGESPEVLRQIRERVRGLVAADERAAMEQRLRNLLGEHYQEVAKGKARPLAERLKAAGLNAGDAAAVAGTAERVFKGKVAEGKAKVRSKVGAAREEKPLGMLSTDREVDLAVRRQLRQLGLRLDTIIKWHFTRGDETGASLSKRLADGLGLSEDGVAYLAAKIQGRFQALAAERKRALLERLPAMTKARVGMGVGALVRPGLARRLIEMSNLGALSEKKFYDAVKEKLGLPEFTPEIAREVVKRSNALQRLPEGFQQERATVELMNFIGRQKGLKWYELPMSYWYANILSGPATHLVNLASTGLNFAAHVGLEIGKRPGATAEILAAMGRGFAKGGIEAAQMMKTGIITGSRSNKLEAGRALELKQFTGWAAPLNAWKYIGRALGAEDLLFFKPAEEMRMAVAARVIAKTEGLRGADLARRTSEILGLTAEQRSAASAQAAAEGLTGLDLQRRVREIGEQVRPAEMRENAKQYALRVTFNQEPAGVLGAITKGVNGILRAVPAGKLLVPFTNIISNVVNENLNYVPAVGVTRALWGTFTGRLEGKPATTEQVIDQYAKAALGLAALAGVAALAVQHRDERDPRFAVSGAGPTTPEQQHQLRETGWIPYSFKFGDRYVSYANTPLALSMAILGNYLDGEKYRKLDDTDLMNRVAVAFFSHGQVITDQSFLSGIRDLFRTFDGENTKRAGESGVRRVAQIGGGLVPMSGALKQIDQLFDPTVTDARSVQEQLVNVVPFAHKVNQPAINVMGEPVRRYLSDRFTSGSREDELWHLLAEKEAWVPAPQRETVVGQKSRGEGYYRVLTPSELYDYTKMRGQAIRARLGGSMYQLSALPPVAAKQLVEKIAEQESEKAKKIFR